MAEENQNRGIAEFGKLQPAQRQALLGWLEQASPQIGIGRLARLASRGVGIAEELLTTIFEDAAPLLNLQGTEQARILTGFTRYMVQNFSQTPEDQHAALAHDLERLLLNDALLATTKAQQVLWSHGKIFRSAHTITQVRPVFAEDRIGAAVIVHDLKLDYVGEGGRASINLVLDSNKLFELRAALNRAIDKERVLRQGNNFRYLDSSEENA